MVRKGFSLIELVFAIVIVGVTVISLPVVVSVNSNTDANNLEADEAVFEAFVKAVEATDETFAKLTSVAKTDVIENSKNGSLTGLKFKNKYKITVTQNASFGADTNSADIKKVMVEIFDKDDKLITKLYTYKFNM
jgi:prepilin-type N-terminal cleavage/methylation domain-containing protein